MQVSQTPLRFAQDSSSHITDVATATRNTRWYVLQFGLHRAKSLLEGAGCIRSGQIENQGPDTGQQVSTDATHDSLYIAIEAASVS